MAARGIHDQPLPAIRERKTVDNEHLRRVQRVHARIVNWVSFVGSLFAIALLWHGYGPGTANLVTFAALWFLTTVGIVVGYHRLFTHRSFVAVEPLRALLAILGSMAAQGTVSFWVALHRFHHVHSDRPGDPHSPYIKGDVPLGRARGLWHAYVGWTVDHRLPNPLRYARDVLRDPTLARINRYYFLWVALGLVIPFAVGAWADRSWLGGLLGLLWGGLLRVFLTQNLVWSITSLAHIVGSRPMDSGDRSTNNFWIAIPTLGDSWHNNHHAFPNAAIVGWEWWQIDIAGWLIRLLERCRLVRDVCVPGASDIAARRRDAAAAPGGASHP